MDLIRQMAARRAELGLNAKTAEAKKDDEKKPPSVAISLGKVAPKSLRERRNEIIENKPKLKKVKEYFEEVIDHALQAEESDD
jgi:GTP1/Obg family GTP-binding protein